MSHAYGEFRRLALKAKAALDAGPTDTDWAALLGGEMGVDLAVALVEVVDAAQAQPAQSDELRDALAALDAVS